MLRFQLLAMVVVTWAAYSVTGNSRPTLMALGGCITTIVFYYRFGLKAKPFRVFIGMSLMAAFMASGYYIARLHAP